MDELNDFNMFESNAQISDPMKAGAYRNLIQNGVIYAPGVPVMLYGRTQHNYYGSRLRDEWLQNLPLLPAAVAVFQQIAVSREWRMTGTPRRAARAVEKLNNATLIDATGRRWYGWQEFAARRVVDWLTLGETAMIVPYINRSSGNRGPIQYVDPIEVKYSGNRPIRRVIYSDSTPSSGYFRYDTKDWPDDEIFFNHIMPIGGRGQIYGPLVPAVPMARLLWLIMEHDQAALDGRKIRDIIITADGNMRDAVIEAVLTSAAVWNEYEADKHGVPIVAANKKGGFAAGEKVEDLIHIMGLSNIPESYDRQDAWDNAANYISGLLGMELRSWYHDSSGSNRSLERVNQERARVKGPSYFCRSEQRHINQSGIFPRVYFSFVEETDISLEKTKAEVVKTMAEAVEKLSLALGEVVTGNNLLTYLQRMGVFLEDYDLIDEIVTMDERQVQPDKMVDADIQDLMDQQAERERERQRERELYEARLERDKQKIIAEAAQNDAASVAAVNRFVRMLVEARNAQPQPVPSYGEISVDQDGFVVDTRRKYYPVSQVIAQELELPPPADFNALQSDMVEFFNRTNRETDTTDL